MLTFCPVGHVFTVLVRYLRRSETSGTKTMTSKMRIVVVYVPLDLWCLSLAFQYPRLSDPCSDPACRREPKYYADFIHVNTEPEFVKLLRSPGIDYPPGGPVRQPYLTYWPARLHRLPKPITGLLKGSDQRENRRVWSNIITRYLVWGCGDGRSFVL